MRWRWSLTLWAGVLLLGAALLSVTSYTQPIFPSHRDGPVERLIHQALGDVPRLPPGWNSTATGIPLTSVPGTPDSLPPARISPAQVWARAAVAADSGALRGWLSPAVLELGSVAHDTVRVTLYRLTLRQGCPLFSHLDAVLIGYLRSLEVARVAATCPRVTLPAPSRADSLDPIR